MSSCAALVHLDSQLLTHLVEWENHNHFALLFALKTFSLELRLLIFGQLRYLFIFAGLLHGFLQHWRIARLRVTGSARLLVIARLPDSALSRKDDVFSVLDQLLVRLGQETYDGAFA